MTIGALDLDRAVGWKVRHVACDALLVSGGFSPTLHLFAQAGGKLEFSEESGAFVPAPALRRTSPWLGRPRELTARHSRRAIEPRREYVAPMAGFASRCHGG